jgi:hypothetical protein
MTRLGDASPRANGSTTLRLPASYPLVSTIARSSAPPIGDPTIAATPSTPGTCFVAMTISRIAAADTATRAPGVAAAAASIARPMRIGAVPAMNKVSRCHLTAAALSTGRYRRGCSKFGDTR